MTPGLPELLRAFSLVTYQTYAERDAERADHAETKALADNLERDLRREKALRVESETVRRGMSGDTADLTAVTESVAEVLQDALDNGDARVLAVAVKAQAGRLRALVGPRDRIEAKA